MVSLRTITDVLYEHYMINIMVQLYGCSREEAKWMIENPILGPPVPKSIKFRRRMQGHPIGKYVRSKNA